MTWRRSMLILESRRIERDALATCSSYMITLASMCHIILQEMRYLKMWIIVTKHASSHVWLSRLLFTSVQFSGSISPAVGGTCYIWLEHQARITMLVYKLLEKAKNSSIGLVARVDYAYTSSLKAWPHQQIGKAFAHQRLANCWRKNSRWTELEVWDGWGTPNNWLPSKHFPMHSFNVKKLAR